MPCWPRPTGRMRRWRSCPSSSTRDYGLIPDFAPYAEGIEGPTLRHLSRRSRQWRMGIAGGFVERDGRHLYDCAGALSARRLGSRLSQAAPGLLGAVPISTRAGRRWWSRRRGERLAWRSAPT